MPTISDVINTAVPVGTNLAQYLANRGGLNSATSTVTQGVNNASTQLNTAAGNATQAQKDALAEQQRLAGVTTGANAPYVATGTQGVNQLGELIKDPNSLSTTPGYQFELNAGLQGGERAAAARGTVGNGGQVKAQTRYALDYANTKYNDAVQRLLQVTNVGQTANAANQRANETLAGETGTEASNVGNIGTKNAEDQASLTLAQAQLAANNQVAQGANTASLVKGLTPTILSAAQKLFPTTPAAGSGVTVNPDTPSIGNTTPLGPNAPAGIDPVTGQPIDQSSPTIAQAAGIAAPAVAGIGDAALAGGGAAAAATPAVSVAIPELGIGAGEAAGAAGAVGSGASAAGAGATEAAAESGAVSSGALSSVASLLTNPITIGVGAAIGAALIWKATQTHPVASEFVSKFQDPFVNTKGTGKLNNVVDEFDKAYATGQMTKPQAQSAYQHTAQLIQSFMQDGANFAKQGDKQMSVWKQAVRTMAQDFGGTVSTTGMSTPDWSKLLGKMQSEVNSLPDQAAA